MNKIPTVIIATPGMERFKPLANALEHGDLFDIIILRATMGHELLQASDEEKECELKNYGRFLTANERACSISHAQARRIISESKIGGIIFEDDARILHLALLQEVAIDYLERFKDKKRVLNLVQYHPESSVKRFGKFPDVPRYFPLLAESPLAVATIQTKFAAADLNQGAKTYSQVSDWPHSNCRFHILRRPLVSHGDEDTSSVIGKKEERIDLGSLDLVKNLDVRRVYLLMKRKLDLVIIRILQ